MLIGILALQGAFEEHKNILNKLGIDSIFIRQKSDLNSKINGLIIPGGESTAIGRLLIDIDLKQILIDKINNGLPVFGTCAGLIILAKHIENQAQTHLNLMDITVKRNAFGRQLGSFNFNGTFNNTPNIPMPFIRAPYIVNYSKDVEILSIVQDKVVAARQKNMLATAFHPELTTNTFVHEYFINMIKELAN